MDTQPPASRPRLCFMGYRHLRQLALPVVADYQDRADIDFIDATFTDALARAHERLGRGPVDAFVSAGSNAGVLRQGLQAPVATIELTGFDLMQALLQARRLADRVGVVTWGQPIPELDAVKGLLKVELRQHVYRTPEDARGHFEALRRDGFRVIVGSSLVVEMAEAHGLTGVLAYSLASVRRGIEDGLELARVARLEASRYAPLNGVLANLQEAVLAVDTQHRITALNPPMARLLERPASALLGQALDEVAPALSLRDTLRLGQAEQGALLRFAQRDWMADRHPVRQADSLIGATLALHDAHDIEAADTRLRQQQRRGQPTVQHHFGSLVGQSPAFARAVQAARRYAHNDLTVLITGESGTGKELFAQAIHSASARAARPFVAVNCAALPESLLESELFGYEEGSFTGARRGGRRGLIEAAHTGTLFLDEIGDMPLALQSRMLRVLQEREVTRLGGGSALPVDLRVMAATHQPLAERVAQRQFREDLYYRLNALRLPLPPLRERPQDMAPLARLLLGRSLARLGSRVDVDAALALWLPVLQAYPWPGNVRELQNLCERLAVRLADPDRTAPADQALLQDECPELFGPPSAPAAPLLNGRPDATQLADILRQTGQNRQAAARRLGVSRSTLWRWLREHGLPPS